ncbi:lysylphosphatidylglycerol synthase transmembrane domain-containing protein [uncultured Hymenobacter sp.]|uniref:lysylphosphatidylglycerol synthase transmembrane domain-containing protein n=1 Tax=uncultured Hymenobacter sp. TaxID=170016 RepID=UPI0035CBAABE
MKQLLTILKYALLLAISGLLMAYAIRGQDLSRIGQTLREANYGWLALTLLLSALGYGSRAYRWKMQLDSATGTARTSYAEVYHAMMVGYLANLVLPRMGEVIRCSILRRTGGVPVEMSLGTVVAERIIDVVVLLSLLGATLLVDFNKFWAWVTDWLLKGRYDALARNQTTLIVVAAMAAVLLAGALFGVLRNLERLQQNAVFNRLVGFARGMLAGVFSVLKLERKGLFLFHTLFTWSVYFLTSYLTFFAFPETSRLGLGAGLAVLTFGAFGMAAPVSGGIGTFHLLVQSTLLVYGISKEGGIAYALVAHGAQTLLVVLMGGISFVASMARTGRGKEVVSGEMVS